MRTAILCAFACAFLAGCAAPVNRPPKVPAVAKTVAPLCHNKRQCEAMWADAQESIGMATGMRNRIITDTRIETFAASGYGRMTGIVTKTPVGAESYRIEARFECYQHTTCGDMRATGTDLFNTLVEGAGITFRQDERTSK